MYRFLLAAFLFLYSATESEHAPLLDYETFSFFVDGRPVVNLLGHGGQNRIEAWHEHASETIRTFSASIFGRMKGNNWAMASLSVLYEDKDRNVLCSDIIPFPHVFTSGERKALPSTASTADERIKLEAVEKILAQYPLYFVTTEFGGSEDEKMHEFILTRMRPFVLENIDFFVTPYRLAEKIIQAFEAYVAGVGDKNLARNWFSDSEQGILIYLEKHSDELMAKVLEDDHRPIALILNITTLNDMCGMCYRSVELTKTLNSTRHGRLPIFSFVVGLRPYGAGENNSRSRLRKTSDAIMLDTTRAVKENVFVKYG